MAKFTVLLASLRNFAEFSFPGIFLQCSKPRLLIVRRHGGSMPATGCGAFYKLACHQKSKSLSFRPASQLRIANGNQKSSA
jgi:hypothetical protein